MTDPSPKASIASIAATSPVPDLAAQWGAEQRLDVATLAPDDRAAAERIAADLAALDGAAVNGFGAETQTRAKAFLDELLAGIRSADAALGGADAAVVCHRLVAEANLMGGRDNITVALLLG